MGKQVAEKRIEDYFQREDQRHALDKYAEVSKARGWWVSQKVSMYQDSHKGFDVAEPQFESFNRVFKILKGEFGRGFGVFRGIPRATDCKHWSAQRIWETIKKEFARFTWDGSVTLQTLLGDGNYMELLKPLEAMKGIKFKKDYPVMAVSKFLHFYNPGLFPIYDGVEIWKWGLRKRFDGDYRRFLKSAGLQPAPETFDTPQFLLNYMCWASHLISSAWEGFMEVFVDWLYVQVDREKHAGVPSPDMPSRERLGTLFATAFEFTAIGAAHDQRD